jgi:hypothetical protein
MSYQSDFVQPPWTQSPKEVEEWINATHPSNTRCRRMKSEKGKKEKFLKNVEISLDLDVEKSPITASNHLMEWIHRLTGSEEIEENFEVIPTAELVARGLAKAKFHNMAKIVMDGKTVYDHPKKRCDIRKAIGLLAEMAHRDEKCEKIELVTILGGMGNGKCTAHVKIKKVHPKKEHSIDIKMEGEIERALFHRFLNYLRNNLGAEFVEE